MTDLIYDANSLYARCWYAAKEAPDQAMSLFVRSVLALLDQDGKIGVPVNRTMFGWDGQSKTDKGRKVKTQAYFDTRYRLQEVLLVLFNTVHAWHRDYEADDVVATAVFASAARRIVVVSGDKDLMQLQGGNVTYFDLNTKLVTDSTAICEKFSIKRPNQLALALAIIGDTGDKVKGIPKWGPKRAKQVFEAVTEDMDFSAAFTAVTRQIPEPLLGYFMDSLDKTLLHTDVPDVPEAADLVFCSGEEVSSLEIPEIALPYDRIARQYEGEDGQEKSLEDMLALSASKATG